MSSHQARQLTIGCLSGPSGKANLDISSRGIVTCLHSSKCSARARKACPWDGYNYEEVAKQRREAGRRKR